MVDSTPTWLSDLERDGFCIVPNAIAPDACVEFCNSAYAWLESFPYGFKRDDLSTWDSDHLPDSFKGGLYTKYAVNHEAWMWKNRIQPELHKAFAKVWSTDDLVVSFDGMNATLPINARTGRTDIKPTDPWPHIDQNPHQLDHLQLCQGIANMAPNGPEDGGLVVVRGSYRLHDAFFKSIGGVNALSDNGEEVEGYYYTMENVKWYVRNGCEVVKICANAGDLILWDSRTIHWNASPVGSQTRFVQYVAYSPRSLMPQSELDKKLELFRQRKGTTGWPHKNVVPEDIMPKGDPRQRRTDGTVESTNRNRPLQEPAESQEILWAVGVRA